MNTPYCYQFGSVFPVPQKLEKFVFGIIKRGSTKYKSVLELDLPKVMKLAVIIKKGKWNIEF